MVKLRKSEVDENVNGENCVQNETSLEQSMQTQTLPADNTENNKIASTDNPNGTVSLALRFEHVEEYLYYPDEDLFYRPKY